MRRPGPLVVFGVLCAIGVGGGGRAEAGDPLKPYVLLMVDTSTSMVNNATGFGPPSCPGGVDTRIDHAKCAINNIANATGDMVLGLGRLMTQFKDKAGKNAEAASLGLYAYPALMAADIMVTTPPWFRLAKTRSSTLN